MNSVELTEKLLADAGGWQAMKMARALCDMGRVISANYTPPLLKGLVREGDTEYRAGLKIVSPTNIENICSCRPSREWGTVCAHSLAVGLLLVRAKNSPLPSKPESRDLRPEKPHAVEQRPFFFKEGPGDSVKLHIVLSPNFLAAWDRNQVMIGAEAEWAGRRILLNALDAKRTYRCAPEDLRIIEKIRALNDGKISGMMILPQDKARELLESMRAHPRVTLGKATRVEVAELLRSLPGGIAAELSEARTDDVIVGETASPEAQRSSDAENLPLVATEPTTVVAGGTPTMTPEFSLTVEGSLNFLSARLQATYGKRVVTIGVTDRHDKFPGRNLSSEESALKRLEEWGFMGPDTTGHYTVRGENRILGFFANALPQLQREWSVSIGARFQQVTEPLEHIKPRIEIQSSGESWFDLDVSLSTPDGERFSSAEIQRLLQMGQSHVRLEDNRVVLFSSGLLDELQNVLRDCDPQQVQPGLYRVNRMHAGYIDSALGEGSEIIGSPGWQQWAKAQRQLDKAEPVPLGSLEEVLRPYQKQGVYWMNFLARNGFGGILADEMGLGKTVQTLAFLRHLGGTALIVCPSSLIHNWRIEAERFTPELRLLLIEGANREPLFSRLGEADLVITSYPLLRRDADRYRNFEFSATILDEAQHIKNPGTQNAQSAAALRSKNRFVLTGTPMENSVRDLWSIMHFLMPGYLGSRNDFRDHYELPISREGAAEVQNRLAKRLRPFMLRRMKRDVITDLPDKIEQVAYCAMTSAQSTLYKELLDQTRKQIGETARDKNQGKNRLLMLTALLRLRQACCDLRLLGLPDIEEGESSGKLQLLGEILQESIDSSHRVIIFSQFVSMLQILKNWLDAQEVAYCYLDGSTKGRMSVVNQFQKNQNIPVFLISLKAGGVGLNLTAADTVIHFDPWWNPAVEAQATDRAHRIGQKKVVTSYKLITRDTVEEKILNLQRKKREQIDAMVESEEPLMSALTMEEIQSLLD